MRNSKNIFLFKEANNLEKPDLESIDTEVKFELSRTPEGREIRERLEKEYDRRIIILKNVLAVLGIPEDLVVLAPPALDRTDFGYTSDVDLVFLGTDEQEKKLYQKLHTSFEILPFIIHLNQEKLTEIKKDLPELYQFLMQRKGNIPTKEGEIETAENYWKEAAELETRSRTILSIEDKLRLKEQRSKIGNSFVDEVKQEVPVLGYTFSGSMMTDIKRFGINSDLDIDLLINPVGEKAERNTYNWIHLFLKWKYAEEFGIKVDVHDTTLEFARRMVSHEPKFVDFYKKEFGIDITETKE
ncbi:MAG: hypothetical protein QMC93_03595 [Patescibacteria group bacterium]|nr:hypothetical protein [Patescibacteria group bacterium]